MNHPTIKSYREDRRNHFIAPIYDRLQFLGRSSLDMRWNKYEPKVNVIKMDNLYEMELTMPGFSKDEISVSIDDNILTVRAERNIEEKRSSEYLLREFNSDVIERKFVLGNDIGHEQVTAKYENGILYIVFTDVPPEEESQYKRVAVQ